MTILNHNFRMNNISGFKYTEEADLDKVYEDVIKTLESEIYSEMSRKEDF